METYVGHHMAIYTIRWNPFHPRVFMSCSADWTVKLWDDTNPLPARPHAKPRHSWLRPPPRNRSGCNGGLGCTRRDVGYTAHA